MTKYEILAKYSELQVDADEMAYQLSLVWDMAVVQGICDFNLFFVSGLSPLVATADVVGFLAKHAKMFKRKMRVGEFMKADFLIRNFYPDDFGHFQKMYSNYDEIIKMIDSYAKSC